MRARILCLKYDVSFNDDIVWALNNAGYGLVNAAMSKHRNNWKNYDKFLNETYVHMYKAKQFSKRFTRENKF
jgi:hypothetical protein